MRFLFWRLERVSSAQARQTRVRIEVQRDPHVYVYRWTVADPKSKRLSKRELHELEMRVEKYVATLNHDAPQQPEHKTYFATLHPPWFPQLPCEAITTLPLANRKEFFP